MSELLAAARAVQRRHQEALGYAVAREQSDLRSALENHGSMPNNYWHERHVLARKVQAVNAIVEVLEEARHG